MCRVHAYVQYILHQIETVCVYGMLRRSYAVHGAATSMQANEAVASGPAIFLGAIGKTVAYMLNALLSSSSVQTKY